MRTIKVEASRWGIDPTTPEETPHEPTRFVASLKCADCGRTVFPDREFTVPGDTLPQVTYTHQTSMADSKNRWAARAAAQKAELMAQTDPYEGEREKCEVAVHGAWHSSRCSRWAKRVRPMPSGEDLLLCDLHAKQQGVMRYVPGPRYGR